MSWTQQVYSEMATEVGYDTENQELLVTWKNGRTTAYKGVPEEKALELANAPSVGKMLNAEIKNNYSFRYV